jgi:exonuclease I
VPGALDSPPRLPVKEFAGAIEKANQKLMAHAVAYSSPQQIASLCGLVDGQVESLSTLKPVFVCHQNLMSQTQYGIYLALGTDPQFAGSYPHIVYMIDLQSDLTALIESGGETISRFIRTDAMQTDRPVVRVNLNCVPFVSPLGVLDRDTALRLGVDPGVVKARFTQLQGQQNLCLALMETTGGSGSSLNADPDFQLFGAEYLEPDKSILDTLHSVEPKQWQPLIEAAHDARITSLGGRLIRRFAPALLSENDRQQWFSHCAARLIGSADNNRVTEINDYYLSIVCSESHPNGVRTAARHWLRTLEVGNDPAINV